MVNNMVGVSRVWSVAIVTGFEAERNTIGSHTRSDRSGC